VEGHNCQEQKTYGQPDAEKRHSLWVGPGVGQENKLGERRSFLSKGAAARSPREAPDVTTHRPDRPDNASGRHLPTCANRRVTEGAAFHPRRNVMRNLYTTERLFEDLFGLHREFNEMFNRVLTGKAWGRELPEFKNAFTFVPAVEAYMDKEGKKYICRVTLPGVEPKDLQIHTQGNLLTIRGERKLARRAKETELFEEEIAYGVFERILTLPEGVTAEKLTAEYVNGVLEIAAPVSAAALPRKIEVKTAPPMTKQIAA
jgi:HSP20 family protein